MISLDVKVFSVITRDSGRTASSRLSMPHSPQAGGSGQMPSPVTQTWRRAVRLSHICNSMPASCSTMSSCRMSAGEGNQAFGEAEAESKVFQILRRRHHHRIGAAVVGKSDCGLFGMMRLPSVAP